MNPVIVIGPPRSGSSVIARLLQTNLGVMMDEGPIRKDTSNPQGYYEDCKLVDINQRAFSRWQPGKNNEDKVDPMWAVEFAKWLTYRSIKYRNQTWGWKEPRMVGILPWMKQFVNGNTIWIVTDRSDEQIIKSQVQKIGVPNRKIAKAGLLAYRRMIEKHLNNYHRIDLTEHREEAELTEALRRITNGC